MVAELLGVSGLGPNSLGFLLSLVGTPVNAPRASASHCCDVARVAQGVEAVVPVSGLTSAQATCGDQRAWPGGCGVAGLGGEERGEKGGPRPLQAAVTWPSPHPQGCS